MIVYAEVFGIILGIIIAIIRIYKIPVLNQVYSVYISFMRGTPILVQLLVVFYGVPTVLLSLFNIDVNGWDKFIFATIALTLNESAMLAEIFRSAIASIPHTQFEAGYSVGLTWWQTFTRIILPQAVRVAIPSYGTNLVVLIQSTSLAYMIGVIDLMGRARAIGTSTRHSFEPYVAVTIVYVVFSLLVKLVFYLLNKKLQYGNRK
jgi:L-cystine transport system permease protein